MLKHILAIFFILTTLLYSEPPTVDIRNIQAPKNLDGEWAFSYGSLNFSADKTFAVPAYWEDYGLDVRGCATYELLLLTTPQMPLVIDMARPYTAYRLFVDGEEIGRLGEIDETAHTSKPSYKSELISWTPKKESSRLTLWLCNHSHRHGGIDKTPRIAPPGMLGKQASVNMKIQWMLLGILLTMGLYHIGLYSAWNKQRAPLWFGLACFALLFRMASTGEKILISAFPSLSWDNLVRIEYISGFISIPLFVLYMGSLYPSQMPKIAGRIFFAVGAVFCLITILFQPIFFTAMVPYFNVVIVVFLAFISLVLYRSYKAKEPNALTAVFGFTVFSITILHDLLMIIGFIQGGDWVPFGFLFYLLAQAKLLIDRYVAAFKKARQHEVELENLNSTLEETVNKRTKILSGLVVQRELLLREINHRVKNNLQFIMRLLWLGKKQESEYPYIDILGNVQLQIKAISIVYELLCTQKDFAHLNAAEYIESMLSSFKKLYPGISFDFQADKNCELDADNAMAVGLIINELITNSVKHGFKEMGQQRIFITFFKNEQNYILSYSDGENAFNLDAPKSSGFGSSMIKDLCHQLGATTKKEDVGGVLKIEFLGS